MLIHWTFIAISILAVCYGTFINYKPGYEYIYDFSSTLDVKTLHKLDALGKVIVWFHILYILSSICTHSIIIIITLINYLVLILY